MTTGAEDRLNLLLNQSALTGIDFVYVYPTQDRLDIYFLRAPETMAPPLPGTIPAANVRIANSRDPNAPSVIITNLSWAVADGRTVMRLEVIRPASFANHRLTINHPRIDPFFSSKEFSFQANCESGLDCSEPDEPPFPESYVDFPIDYTARDFLSFRRALLDFASQRYPRWVDRLEADAGIMLVEVMSALADEMAYYQDRIAREAYLETASQRFSLRNLARLVDYEIFDGQAATTWIDVTCMPPMNGTIAARTPITDAGNTVVFEVGSGLFDKNAGYDVDAARNLFTPYFWDEDDTVLPAASTEVDVAGNVAGALPSVSGGWLILLQTNPADPSEPAVRLLVRLQSAVDFTDPLTGDLYTRLTWDAPTPYAIDKVALEVRGNLVPATAGLTQRLEFSIGEVSSSIAPANRAIVRRGANGAPVYRFSLPGSDEAGVAHLFDPERGGLRAEVRLYRAQENLAQGRWDKTTEEWHWRNSLIGVASSIPSDMHFTLDDGTWGQVVSYPIPGDLFRHSDYKSDLGYTIRFGDGEFGAIPPEGTVFIVEYRLNTGDNLPRHLLNRLATPIAFVQAVTNPVAAEGGLPSESVESIRKNAPEAFRTITERAVRTEDYAEAVERLEFVQHAGASMRWTGSWRTIFVAADPLGAVELLPEQVRAIDEQIDRFRQAGQDARQFPPRYADLDIEIHLCALATSYAGAVKEAVIEALTGPDGFFSPDRFTFGTRLYRGALEAAVGTVAGVHVVESIRFRRRGFFTWREFDVSAAYYDPGMDVVIRMQNDPLYPDRGTLRVVVRGGA